MCNKMAQRQSTSIVWNFFEVDKDETSRVICKLCGKSFSRGGKTEKAFNTTNLRKHLESQHRQELDSQTKLLNEEKKRLALKRPLDKYVSSTKSLKEDFGAKAGTSTQINIEDAFELKKNWDINGSKSKKIHYAIGEMIAVDCQPISVVEDLGFSRLMKTVQPNYELPSRKYFSERIIPSIHSSVLRHVKDIVNKADNISFTTDIWKSKTGSSFISLTGHCVSSNFDCNTVVLRSVPFEDGHTGENITQMIRNTLNEFEVPHHKVHTIVRDNGRNIVKGVQDTGYDSLSCFLHTLQLVIQDCVLNHRTVKDLITNCKQMVGHFNHSSAAQNKLADLQKQHNLPHHTLVQDVSTRWNSTFFMLQRIYEQKKALVNYSVDMPNFPVLDANKWNFIGKLISLLKVFHKTTVRLSDRNSLASEIIPQIKFLNMFLRNAERNPAFIGMASIICTLKDSMKCRFEQYLEDYNMIIGTFIDPRYKNSLFEADIDSTAKTFSRNIQKMMTEALERILNFEKSKETKTMSTEIVSEQEHDDDIDDPAEVVDLTEVDFNTCYDQLVAEVQSQLTSSGSSTTSETRAGKTMLKTSLESEIEAFLATEAQPLQENPLDWWRKNKSMFSKLSLLASKYLSNPPSSIESERLFSIGGNIYSPHRNRLHAGTGESLMFLNYNLRMFNFKYDLAE